MLRGADFIIEVVSARVSDSIQTIFEDACISDDKTANGTKTWSCSLLTQTPYRLSGHRDFWRISFHWTPASVLGSLKHYLYQQASVGKRGRLRTQLLRSTIGS